MPAVAAAMLAGAGVEALMALTMASRTGLRHRWSIPWRHPGLLRVFTLSVPMMLGGLAGQAYLIIDRRLASALEPGSISALAFASKLVQLPLGLFVIAITTVLYPLFSEYASRRDHPALGRSIQFGLRLVALITIPASIGLVVLREPIIRLLFQRGEFDARATQLTAVAVLCYGLGMLFIAANQVLVRGFHARQDMTTPVLIGGATFCVNVLCAVLLVRPWGHAGLALANSIGAISGTVLLAAGLGRALPLHYAGLAGSLGRMSLASLAMGGSAYLGHLGAQQVFGGRWNGLLEVGVGIGAGCLVYALILWRLRLPEIQTVLTLVRERIRS
ncbi:MAG TPA: murein biosynthesis integral membrane protein MurJ [Clostridiales bacterium UBA8153]|nr:murein biosynthesis integral membrane protein MurJ [Clostridiales bacterium UBA8153]